MKQVTIVIDTREQLPYSFNPGRVVHRALPAGDYSVEGYETAIAVERKSIDDFVQSVIRDRERFKRELAKLCDYTHACIVVEAGLPEMLAGQFSSGAHPHAVFGAAVSICVDHGVPVYFCGDRQVACRFTHNFLLRAAAKLKEEAESS